MQLYAYDQDRLILATAASRRKDYLCPECGSILRLRSGFRRQPHFYHRKTERLCKLSQKSMEHIKAQLLIKALLPSKKASLEQKFPEINRIADVYDPSLKLVFEVQCSPISLEEARERNEDYRSLGLEVIWILHDNRFNKRVPTAAEEYLRKNIAYFTNIDAQGRGRIYDQFEVIERGMRLYQGTAVAVDISQCKRALHRFESNDCPKFFSLREKSCKHYFRKDLIDRFYSASDRPAFLAYFKETEERFCLNSRPVSPLSRFIKRWGRMLYILLLQNV